MKIHKLRKSDIKSLYDMYKRLDCIHKDRYAFPYHTFVSPKTYKQIEKVTAQEYKKEHPHLNKRSLATSVGMYLLNLGPSVLTGLPDNVILVDTKSVKESKESLDNALSNDGGTNDQAST